MGEVVPPSAIQRNFMNKCLSADQLQVYIQIFFSLSWFIFCVHPEEEKKKKVVRLPVQRSVETGLAIEFKSRFTRQLSRDPDAEDPKPGAYE